MTTGFDRKNAFLSFYKISKTRLEEKISAYNEAFVKEPHPLLAPFFADFADLNEGGKLLRGVFVNLGCALALSEAAACGEAEGCAGMGETAAGSKAACAGIDEAAESGKEDYAGMSLAAAGSDALALAFEIFQTAVLIHDDIIDHAELRRGKKTSHRRYAQSLDARGIYDRAGDTPDSAALCLGDAGLYAANLVIAENYRDNPKLGELISYFDSVVIDTIRGELLDVILPCEIADPSLGTEKADDLLARSVREIYHLKTARYSVIGPLHLGMLYGGASPELMEAVDRFADEAGVAFQIKDDILGIFAEETKLGKDVGSDIAEAKLTILYQYVKQHDPAAYELLMEDYGQSPVTLEALARVQNIFRSSGALAFAEHAMETCFKNAESALGDISLGENEKALLYGLLDYLRGRDH